MTDHGDRPSGPVAEDAAAQPPLHPVEPVQSPDPPASTIADDAEHKLDPRSIAAARTSGAIVLTVLAGAELIALLSMLLGGAAFVWTLLVLAIFVAVLGALGGFVWFWPALRYRYAAYRVNERGIHIRDGVLWRSVVSVPRSRVQHTDVSQGPLARAYGLATLIIHTAGTEHASVTLDGLPRDTAYAIRDHLIDLGEGEDDAV